MCSRTLHGAIAGACLIVMCLAPSAAPAKETNWQPHANTSFNNAANWSDGVPGVDDVGIFNLVDLSSTTVTLTASATVNELRMRLGTINFNLSNAFFYLLTTQQLNVGYDTGDSPWLKLNSGLLNSDWTDIGHQGGNSGRVTVYSGATWDNDYDVSIGRGATGLLEVGAGGTVHLGQDAYVGNTISGEANAAAGTINVSGSTSRLALRNMFVAGRGDNADSTGRVVVDDYATVTGSGVFIVGSSSTATMLVSNSSTVTCGGSPGAPGFVVGSCGGTFRGSGYASIGGEGTTLTALSQLQVGDGGDGQLRIEGGAVVDSRKATSSTLSSGIIGRTTLGLVGDGHVTVTGAGSLWTQDGSLGVGLTGGGTLLVEAEGVVESVYGHIGRRAGSEGLATVTGAGSLWAVSDELYIGGEAPPSRGGLGAGGTGTFNVRDGAVVTVGRLAELWGAGTWDLTGGGWAVVGAGTPTPVADTVAVTAGGTLAGTGAIKGRLLSDGGTIMPGHSTGVLSADSFEQTGNGRLAIEIGGPALGDYDQLDVTGQASLGGFLDLVQLNSYVPSYGQSFRIVKAASTSGVFAGTPGYQFAPSVWMAVLYDADGVRAVAAHPGDANINGSVNVGDLGILALNWNDTGKTWATGDFTGDGIVNVGDLGVLAANWGWERPTSPGAMGEGSTAIPEPATLSLLALGGLAMLRRRRQPR